MLHDEQSDADLTDEMRDIDAADEAEDIEEADEAEEIIDPIEADAVIGALEQLMAQVKSQTIRDYLECTCEDIALLIEDDGDIDEDESADIAEAA